MPATTGKRLRDDEGASMNGKKRKKQVMDSLPAPLTDETRVTKYLALDCEMVGVGPEGIESMLAQVVVVNSFGNVVYNKYVAPMEEVIDYRTHVSGVRKEHLVGGTGTLAWHLPSSLSLSLSLRISISPSSTQISRPYLAHTTLHPRSCSSRDTC